MTRSGGGAQRDYLHGSGARERRRLEAQAELLGGDSFLPSIAPGTRVLEVGCGTGAIARRVASRVVPGRVVGLDREPEQISSARELSANTYSNLTFEVGSAEELPYPEGDFDVAYCRFLLEHLSNPSRALAEMARVVRPGGWVCALEWAPDCLVMYPDCPNVRKAWQAIYSFQTSTGVDPHVGRRLYELFRQVGMVDVHADSLGWSVTASQRKELQLYVSGAREVIRQTQANLLAGGFIGQTSLDLALAEYESLLASPSAFISHLFCRARGIRA
ncbi:MAG TPA: methyltransferase domain-containing protein [Candidatus Dormibacteraeota bacterium]|nr:methyltransferase domain-containing protein [Candidatus Dormibacteraeota bacterium]